MKIEQKIENIGSFFEIDRAGYIQNPAKTEKLQQKWLPVINETQEKIKNRFKINLHSTYIRGSIAIGKAIDNISDVDIIIILNNFEKRLEKNWSDEISQTMSDKYPFITGIDLEICTIPDLNSQKPIMIFIKTQSLCIFGEDIAPHIKPLKPGPDTQQHIQNITAEINLVKSWLKDQHTGAEIEMSCAWIMKRILRSGFELVMEATGEYTRDLYPCYQSFSKFYPDKDKEMYQVLELSLNPISDSEKIIKILNGIGFWVSKRV